MADALLPPGGEPPPPDGALAGIVDALAASASDDARRLEILLAAGTAAAARGHAASFGRPFATRHPVPMPVEAERLATRFASWYELFPRSQSGSARRHGTFDDVIARLPAIRAMGFDVLYFPPIHPIGRTHRKGRNNSLRCEPVTLAAPTRSGRKKAGTMPCTRNSVRSRTFTACAMPPRRPGWSWRWTCRPVLARSSLAEGAPGVVRASARWLTALRGEPAEEVRGHRQPGLLRPGSGGHGAWQALRDVVMFWLEQGVRIFRVDNPHTAAAVLSG